MFAGAAGVLTTTTSNANVDVDANELFDRVCHLSQVCHTLTASHMCDQRAASLRRPGVAGTAVVTRLKWLVLRYLEQVHDLHV